MNKDRLHDKTQFVNINWIYKTIMSILSWIEDHKKLKIINPEKVIDTSSLWTRCDNCGAILYIKHLKENLCVCPTCGSHLQMNSRDRIMSLIDTDTWRPLDETLSPCNPLQFNDQKTYDERLQESQDRTKLQDAILTGTGLIDGIPVALGAMDFSFMGGSMGSVVGEKITRLIEYATRSGYTLILVCASGGARMQEGILSLMQMAKISSALNIYQSSANLLYISILTSPTTGGVTASFAMLGDLIFAEPNALIGFAGRRIIEQTLALQEELPENFQTAEYLADHGLCDLIIPRKFLRSAISEVVDLYKDPYFKKRGKLPPNLKHPFNFLIEEKVRRFYNKYKNSEIDFKIFDQINLSILDDQSFISNKFLYHESIKDVNKILLQSTKNKDSKKNISDDDFVKSTDTDEKFIENKDKETLPELDFEKQKNIIHEDENYLKDDLENIKNNLENDLNDIKNDIESGFHEDDEYDLDTEIDEEELDINPLIDIELEIDEEDEELAAIYKEILISMHILIKAEEDTLYKT